MKNITSPVTLDAIAAHLDERLRIAEIEDYAGALNGVQVEHVGPVHGVAVAVDASLRTIEGAAAAQANLLVVHHGLFWGGTQPLRAHAYARIRALITHDIAVYSAHLPLDLHPTLGNNPLLAQALGLVPVAGFAQWHAIHVGVQGESDVATADLAARASRIAGAEGGALVAVGLSDGRRTRRWGICTGAGASTETLREAAAAGIDTLIVGEGPHHTAVEAAEMGIAVLYAGHYATETFGVRALGAELEQTFGLPWTFIGAPTGL